LLTFRRRFSLPTANAATQLIKLFQSTNVTRIDWLDRAAMEALQEQTKVATVGTAIWSGSRQANESSHATSRQADHDGGGIAGAAHLPAHV